MPLTRLPLTTGVSGTLAAGNGGTGVTSADEIGNIVLLSTATASNDASISFTSGIDSTYDHYIFRFVDIHPTSDNIDFRVAFTTDGTNFDELVTGTGSLSYRNDAANNAGSTHDGQFQTTASATVQNIAIDTGNENDECLNGELELYSPSNSTFKKHYHGQIINSNYTDHAMQNDVHGYVRSTTAVTGVKFSFSGGNIQSGTIILYGVKT